jgi:hypothetical protein
MTRLTELRTAWPLDVTVRNLTGLLDAALETSARLRACAADAAHDGLDECVEAYERLDRLERTQILELEMHLRHQLGAALADAQRRQANGTERTT